MSEAAGPAETWWELAAPAEPEAVEAVAAAFAEWGQGVAIDQPVESSRDGDVVEYPADRPLIVKTYVPLLDPRAEERRAQIEKAVWALGKLRQVGPLVVRTIREEDWANSWKEYFFVHRVGDRTVIVPTWRQADYQPQADDVVLLLDPGMAFGTGLHPTTRLCLRELEQLDLHDAQVLDLGAGSGILAIAAAKLGAAHVDAVEIEPVAVQVCRENVAANGVTDRVTAFEGSLDAAPRPAAGGYQLVAANITIRIILELLPDIPRYCQPGATVVFSGVLAERADDLVAELTRRGWDHLRTEQEQDWVAVVARTPAAPQGN